MRVVIDRFEGDIAVIETDSGMLHVPRALFAQAKEGDIVEITVKGKAHAPGEETPHEIFERLRRKSRRHRKDTASTAENAPAPLPAQEAAEADTAGYDERAACEPPEKP